jgi:hypothetical protein
VGLGRREERGEEEEEEEEEDGQEKEDEEVEGSVEYDEDGRKRGGRRWRGEGNAEACRFRARVRKGTWKGCLAA